METFNVVPIWSGATTFTTYGCSGGYIRCLGVLVIFDHVAKLTHIGSDETADDLARARPNTVILGNISYVVEDMTFDSDTDKPVFLLSLDDEAFARLRAFARGVDLRIEENARE